MEILIGLLILFFLIYMLYVGQTTLKFNLNAQKRHRELVDAIKSLKQ